jgi:hypothetical protein
MVPAVDLDPGKKPGDARRSTYERGVRKEVDGETISRSRA